MKERLSSLGRGGGLFPLGGRARRDGEIYPSFPGKRTDSYLPLVALADFLASCSSSLPA